jgi:hypothetical protein
MTKQDIIKGLDSLIDDRKSLTVDDDDIFTYDIKILQEAKELINNNIINTEIRSKTEIENRLNEFKKLVIEFKNTRQVVMETMYEIIINEIQWILKKENETNGESE